jgi:glycosyltransferase-like protein LARGE
MQDVAVLVESFYKELEKEGQCALDLQLVLEKFERWDDPNIGLYPFNAVRNRALMMVDTDVVILLDADFLPSQELSHMYKQHDSYSELLDVLDTKTAYVLPAFETSNNGIDGVHVARKAATHGKEEVVDAWHDGTVKGFQLDQYSAGHGPTRYEQWLTAQEPYSIKYEKGFEPYIMIARKYVPWYDERFRGYSRNKIVHLTHLAEQLGVKMRVHDKGFVIHTPHSKASTFSKTKETGQWENLLDLYIMVRRDISVGEFVPVTSFAKHCPKMMKAETLIKVIKKKLKSKREMRIARQASRKDITKKRKKKDV